MSKRWWDWEPAFELDPARTALLLIDMQRGFLEPGGVREVPMAREQVPAMARLLAFARSRGLPVVFTAFQVGPEAHYPFYWEMAGRRGSRDVWLAGSPETEISPDLRPAPGEPVVEKCGYDAFGRTNLDRILESWGTRCLVIAGTVVNWCVDSTVRSAFHRGYDVVVVADAVSGYDHAGATGEQWCRMELDLFAEGFARVMATEDVMRELSPRG